MGGFGIIPKRLAVLGLILAGLLMPYGGGGNAGAVSIASPDEPWVFPGYVEQLSFIRDEIAAVTSDLQWLSGKIKTLEVNKRFVPQKMYDSIAFKKEKIASLKKLAARYANLASKQPVADDRTPSPKPELEARLKKQIATSGFADWLVLGREKKSLWLKNRLPILFSSASAQIPDGYTPFLRKLAEILKPFRVRIQVSGYSDTDPIRTDQYPSNFELGAARAGAVVRSLVKFGVKPSVFEIQSTGHHGPERGKPSEWKTLQRHADVVVRFL